MMSLLVAGLNHETAPLEAREAAALAPDQFAPAVSSLLDHDAIREAAILSTCNRTEIYAVADDETDNVDLGRWLCGFRGLDHRRFANCFYALRGRDSVRHSLRVASGLDSMILGEPQILGQMKQALRHARDAAGTGPVITRLFEHSFAAAKQIRSRTAIGVNPISVAYAGAQLASQIFSNLANQRAVMVGAGETIELTARYLADIGIKQLLFANRSPAHAERLATRYDGRAIALTQLENYLPEADLLITSTAAGAPIVTTAHFKSALRARRRRPIFALDLAVPRDIEPGADTLEDVYLYTIDDLQAIADANKRSRRAAADQAADLVEARVDEFLQWMDSRRANETIRAIRGAGETQRDATVARAKRQLARGVDPETVVEQLGYALTNKLLHAPSATLRQASGEHRQRLLAPARDLFKLDDDSAPISDDRDNHT